MNVLALMVFLLHRLKEDLANSDLKCDTFHLITVSLFIFCLFSTFMIKQEQSLIYRENLTKA